MLNFESRNSIRWLITILFSIVLSLEYVTPSNYVFGYLYIGCILLSIVRLSRLKTFQITLISVLLTLSNLWIPINDWNDLSTVANRVIVSMALTVTGILGYRAHLYQDAIAKQQAQLRSQAQLARLREDFVSTLTHDLKTPLLGAIETLKALEREEFGAVMPAQSAVFAMMRRSHQTTLAMVEMVLDVYRNDAEGLHLNLEPINLTQLAEEAVLTLRELASTRRVHLSVRHGASDFRSDLWVQGDRLQLQRVFANLLTNSIHHSPRGGKVEILLESRDAFQTVKVVDNGLGIPPEALPHLFERFYQGHSDRQAKGSGLGLYLSRQIIEAHKGTIWAENRTVPSSSESPQGAVFAFRLPATVGKGHPTD